jgi:hypothetical protein
MTTRNGFLSLLAVVAMLALAPTALAKGGGGGGGGGDATCATLNSFGNALGSSADGPTITTSYSVFNGCVDEFMASINVTYKNETTGFVGTSVVMASYGLNTSSRTWLAGYSTRYTITIAVYSPNGKVQATQSQRVETPAAPAA